MTSVEERVDAPETGEDHRRWSSLYPELGKGPIDTERFISEERLDEERKLIFSKSWLNLGSVHDLQGNNSFFVRDVALLGVSLLVVQDKAGKIQVFHNVCSHRGNKLVWEADGPCPYQFACRFHGWGYKADGTLASVPDEEEFFFEGDLPNKSTLGLVPVRTEVWNGFIFVNMDKDGTETLLEHLGPLGESLQDFPFDTLELRYRYDVPDDANWKVILDAQNEIYHLPMLAPLHRFLGGGAFSTNEDGYTRLYDFERLGIHTVYTSDSDAEWVDTPLRTAMANLHPEYNVVKLPNRGPFVFHVQFPNMVIGFLGNFMFTYNIWPVSVGHSVWEIRMHYPKAKTLADRVCQDLMKVRFRDLLCEDVTGHAALQIGLTSKARPEIVLGEQEVQIRSFHKNVDDYIARSTNV
ncbi:MAG: Iron sulfur protein large subunit of 2-hydroxypyridine dioxygenase [Frankiales bacterium]|jgi:phenylpropionate dioxygenase-like ring-hydroxylating dioxygenase large terminal subunit|nr:Iron sulfur protein large subunit of 2-hydroxypyridine dioxygenase [Frankiales bacterium]